MNVFFDTNILLDVLANRKPFYDASLGVWALAEQQKIKGLVSTLSFSNIFYIVQRLNNAKSAWKAVKLMRDVFIPVTCDALVINKALDSDAVDFEDAIQYFSAINADAACIISRNVDHFPHSDVPVLTPREFLATYSFE